MNRHWLAVAALSVIAAPVLAQTSPVIVAARAAGQVGERFDGYLGYAQAPDARLRAQVESVNIRRRALYSDLAARSGTNRVEVGIAAGCELLATVTVGQAYMLGDNVWRRRAPGDAVPTPNYCRR